jgi:integral membrane protein
MSSSASVPDATSTAKPAPDLRTLRLVSFVEGLSLLALLAIAMPLKYVWGMPMAVRIVGMAHGLLFVWLLFSLFSAHVEHDWKISRSSKLFVLACLPFGFLLMERDLRRT